MFAGVEYGWRAASKACWFAQEQWFAHAAAHAAFLVGE
jgi:hypothetical protein